MNIYLKPVHWFTFQNKQTNEKSRLICHTHQALAGTACRTCVLLIRQWAEAFDYIS